MTKVIFPSNPWGTFLAQQPQHGDSAEAGNFAATLTGLGLLAFSGDNAASFLHNQLTNDVEHLGAGEVRLAGYCTPKGRLLATMLLWKNSEAIILALPRVLLPAIQKRLQMFVLRAKVKVQDISEQQAIIGLAGDRVGAALEDCFPELPARPYAKIDNAAGTLMRLADGHDGNGQGSDIPRYQWIAANDVAIEAWPRLAATLAVAGEGAWTLGDIQAGVPQITPATQEKFVPQMINFELIGGVNFKKGCYPGQEIVARSQYLGKPKRRMVLATVEGDPTLLQAGLEIFSGDDPEQPCGMIVNAARDANGVSCLVEIKLAAQDSGTIHAGSANGPLLHFHSLPYSLAEPAELA